MGLRRDGYNPDRMGWGERVYIGSVLSASAVFGLAAADEFYEFDSPHPVVESVDDLAAASNGVVTDLINSEAMETPLEHFDQFVSDHRVLADLANYFREAAGQPPTY